MSLFESASLVITPNGTKASKLYAIKPTDASGDLSVTRATTATRVNSSGLIESLANNVPRLDYTNSTCPSILVEPQRTNISNYIESGTGNFQSGGVTSGTSILGLTAFKVTTNTDTYGDAPYLNANSEYQANTSYTISFYTDFSKCTGAEISVSFLGFFPSFAYAGINVNKTTKAITTFNVNGVWTLNSYSATQINGEIYKIICTATPNALSLGGSRNYISTTNTFAIELAGLQLESGSYATSYIQKTIGGSITRNADVISKTGISSLIGQTEGTIFVEEIYDANVANNGGVDDTLVSLSDGTTNNLISIFHYGSGADGSRKVLFFIRLSNATQAAIFSDALNSGTYKIALAYKNNDVVAYINGVQIGTDTSATIPATSALTLVDPITLLAASKTVNFKSVALFKTRLSNTELATLTTI